MEGNARSGAVHSAPDYVLLAPGPTRRPLYPSVSEDDPVQVEIDRYLQELSFRTTSKSTRDCYRYDIVEFRKFCESLGVTTVAGITRDVMVDWLTTYRSRGLAESTVARKNAALRGFLAFLVERGFLDRRVSAPKVAKPRPALPRILAEDQIRQIISSVGRRRLIDLRDLAILEFLYSSGCRVGELCALNLEDVNFRLDTESRLWRAEAKVRGKGGYERMVFLLPRAADCLRTYIDRARCPIEVPQHERAVFLSREGYRLNRSRVSDMVRKRARDAGILEHVTPHWFRHAFATHMLRHGASVEHVRNMLGHKSAETTQIYMHLSANDLRLAHERFHPESATQSRAAAPS